MIKNWLEDFKASWVAKDIDAVVALFSDDEYWETPFRRIANKDELIAEWQAIKEQHDIELNFDILVTEGTKNVVKWWLRYQKDNATQEWAGLYIIELNEEGKCTYFYHVGEPNA